MTPPGRGRLYLVATPIGNLDDMTFRAVRVLQEVDLVAAEDTRTARVLFSRFQISTPTLSLFDGNERARTGPLIERLKAGQAVAVISEAGTPLLSDPGFPLVQACVAQGIEVDAIPGPSAVTTALLLSGFAVARFRFVGFLPRRGGARRRLLQNIATDPDAVILFEAPRRLQATLGELAELIGGRQLAVLREMTKLHQETLRGTAQQLRTHFEASAPRGELTLVVSPRAEAPPGPVESPGDSSASSSASSSGTLVDLVRDHLAAGDSPRDTARQLSELGYSKRTAYQLALEIARQLEAEGQGS